MIETVVICSMLTALLIFKEWRMAQAEQVWKLERQSLLQRIQAPEQAVVDHSVAETQDLTLHVPFDDDEEAFLAQERRNGRNPY